MSRSDQPYEGAGARAPGPHSEVFLNQALALYAGLARGREPNRRLRQAVAASLAAALLAFAEGNEDGIEAHARILAAPFGEALDRMARSEGVPAAVRGEAARLSGAIRRLLGLIDQERGR